LRVSNHAPPTSAIFSRSAQPFANLSATSHARKRSTRPGFACSGTGAARAPRDDIDPRIRPRSLRRLGAPRGRTPNRARFAAARRGIATTIPDVVAVELPFIPRGKDGRKASAGSVYARHGYLVGASMSRWHTARIWEPNASEWRSVLGLNKGGQKRADVNSRVMLWALETVRGARTREGQAFPLRRANRERGEELFDEANAIALAFAALARFRFSLAPPPPP